MRSAVDLTLSPSASSHGPHSPQGLTGLWGCVWVILDIYLEHVGDLEETCHLMGRDTGPLQGHRIQREAGRQPFLHHSASL